MSFILPRRLTQSTRSAKAASWDEPKTPRAREWIPGPLNDLTRLSRFYCCGAGAGAGAPGTGGIGVGCCGGGAVESDGFFFLLLRRVFSVAVVAVFFFFDAVSGPDKPRGAACVCWSATSAASGGAGAFASPESPADFSFFG